MSARTESMVFAALLKHWRGRRGLSQLDLALCADVSARHISFLETGRSRASREMVLRLATALEVPLRNQNEMLVAAGLPAEFEAPDFDAGLPESVNRALSYMLAQHEPFPMAVMNRSFDVLRANTGATRLLGLMCADPSALGQPLNVGRILFDPRLGRSFVVDWPRIARQLLSRIHRESLARPADQALRELVASLLSYPDVPDAFRTPDFSTPSEAACTLIVRSDDVALRFLTAITVFNAPQNVTLEDLRIESYFPMDDATDQAMRRLVG